MNNELILIISILIIAVILPLLAVSGTNTSVSNIISNNIFYVIFPVSLLLLILSYYSWKEKKAIWKIELYLSFLIVIISWLAMLGTIMINIWSIDPSYFLRLAYFSTYAIASFILMRKAKQLNEKDHYWKSLRLACILSGIGIPVAFYAVGTQPMVTCYETMMSVTKSPPEILAAPVYAWRKHKLKQKIKKEVKAC